MQSLLVRSSLHAPASAAARSATRSVLPQPAKVHVCLASQHFCVREANRRSQEHPAVTFLLWPAVAAGIWYLWSWLTRPEVKPVGQVRKFYNQYHKATGKEVDWSRMMELSLVDFYEREVSKLRLNKKAENDDELTLAEVKLKVLQDKLKAKQPNAKAQKSPQESGSLNSPLDMKGSTGFTPEDK